MWKNLIDAAQLLTAIVSVCVAGLAIWYTVRSREDDLVYRELSIRPVLAIELDPRAGKIKLKNVGLGAAEIKSIKYKIGDDEIVDVVGTNEAVEKPVPNATREMRRKVVRALVNQDLYSRYDRFAPRLELSAFFPSAGDVISANAEDTIIDIENISKVSAAFEKSSAATSYDEWLSTIGLSSRGDFQIFYCSITFKYCNSTKTR